VQQPFRCVLLTAALAITACGADSPPDPAAAAEDICRSVADSGDEGALLEVDEAVDRFAADGVAPSQLWHELDVACGDRIDGLRGVSPRAPEEHAEAVPEPTHTPPPHVEPELDVEEEEVEESDRPEPLALGEPLICTMGWSEWECALEEARVVPADELNRQLWDEDDHADLILQLRFSGELLTLEEGFTSSLDEVLSVRFQGGDGLVYDDTLTCAIYDDACLPGDRVPIQEVNRTGMTQNGWLGLLLPEEALPGGRIEVWGVPYDWQP
jgi:hypothetical protein